MLLLASFPHCCCTRPGADVDGVVGSNTNFEKVLVELLLVPHESLPFAAAELRESLDP